MQGTVISSHCAASKFWIRNGLIVVNLRKLTNPPLIFFSIHRNHFLSTVIHVFNVFSFLRFISAIVAVTWGQCRVAQIMQFLPRIG